MWGGHGVGVITLHLQWQLEEVTSSILVVSIIFHSLIFLTGSNNFYSCSK